MVFQAQSYNPECKYEKMLAKMYKHRKSLRGNLRNFTQLTCGSKRVFYKHFINTLAIWGMISSTSHSLDISWGKRRFWWSSLIINNLVALVETAFEF